MSAQIHVEITKPIATVRLEEAQQLRALHQDGWRLLANAFDELSARSDIACVVVCGTGGGAFSDVSHERLDDVGADSDAVSRALRAVRGCAYPTVAVVEGNCIGGGLEIAASCDLRVCGESSRFGAPIDGLGVTADGDQEPLARLLGASSIMERLSSGELVDAERASRFGLVNRVYPDASVVAQGYGLAARIAAGAPLVNRWHKKLMRRFHAGSPADDVERRDVPAALAGKDGDGGDTPILPVETATGRFRVN